jgi:hypothetical protein
MIKTPQIEYFRSIDELRLERTESSVHTEDASLQSSKLVAVGHSGSHIKIFKFFFIILDVRKWSQQGQKRKQNEVKFKWQHHTMSKCKAKREDQKGNEKHGKYRWLISQNLWCLNHVCIVVLTKYILCKECFKKAWFNVRSMMVHSWGMCRWCEIWSTYCTCDICHKTKWSKWPFRINCNVECDVWCYLTFYNSSNNMNSNMYYSYSLCMYYYCNHSFLIYIWNSRKS